MTITPEQTEEIASQRGTLLTRRPIAPGLERQLHIPMPVLDHGFVRVVDYMGNDDAVVQAARVSYGRGTKTKSDDLKLIDYLMAHRHTTPFEMCEIKYHVKLPIFIARQWIRHRTANVNEYSARYSILNNEFYVPNPEDLSAQSTANRQGRAKELGAAEAEEVLDLLRTDGARAYEHYQQMLNVNDAGEVIDESRAGLARELARMNVSLNFYTQWYWKIDLHNLLHFLSLRLDPHAQYEFRLYAEAMLCTVRDWVPFVFDAFVRHRLKGICLSGPALDVIRRMLAGEKVSRQDSKLSSREWDELMAKLQ